MSLPLTMVLSMASRTAAARLPDDDGAAAAVTKIDEVMGGTDDVPKAEEAPDASWRVLTGMLWRLRKLRHNLRTAEAEYEQIEQELELAKTHHLKPLRERAKAIELSLALWHHARRGEDEKRNKTIQLPTGKLTSRAAEKQVQVDDADKFIEWAKTAFTAGVRTPPDPKDEVAKDPVKKEFSDATKYSIEPDGTIVVQATGEKVPGIRLRPGGTADLGINYTAET